MARHRLDWWAKGLERSAGRGVVQLEGQPAAHPLAQEDALAQRAASLPMGQELQMALVLARRAQMALEPSDQFQ